MIARARRRPRRYVVTFYKTVSDAYGHDREICQRTLEVVAADPEAALEEGAAELCRLDRLSDWSQHADRYEIEDTGAS